MGSILSGFEQLVLLALLRLAEGAYGVAVQREISRTARRPTAFGSVYTALTRLEARGYITARLGDPTPSRGGRRKKYFTITAPGRRALATSLRAVQRMSEGIDPIREGR